MELRCAWCFVSLALTPQAVTHACGHRLCFACYHCCHPHECIVCKRELEKSLRDNGAIPKLHASSHNPKVPSHPPPLFPELPLVIPHHHASPPSTSQGHTTPGIWLRSSALKENHYQISGERTENSGDVSQRPRNIQQGEQDCKGVKPGTVSHLKEKYDSGAWTPQEGAAGWKGSEEDPKGIQTHGMHSSRQQETLGRSKDPGKPDTLLDTHPSSQHRTHTKKCLQSNPANVLTKDVSLTSCRTREPAPSRFRTTNPSHSSSRSKDPSPSHSRTTNHYYSSVRTRAPSPPPSGTSNHSRSSSRARGPSPSPSRPRSPSHSLSRSRRPTPTPSKPTESFAHDYLGNDAKFSGTHSKGGSAEGAAPCHTTTHEPLLKPQLTAFMTEGLNFAGTHRPTTSTTTLGGPGKGVLVGGGSSVMTAMPHQQSSSNHHHHLGNTTNQDFKEYFERSEEERKRHLEEQEHCRKEKERLQSELELQKEEKGELQHEVTKLRERWRSQEENMELVMGKEEHLKSINENLLGQIETIKKINMKLDEELNSKKEEMEKKDEELAWMKIEYEEQQKEIMIHEEKVCKKQKEIQQLWELITKKQNLPLLQEQATQQEQMRTLTQENMALKEELASVKKAKDKQENEAMYWKQENAKQRDVAEEKLGKYRLRVKRLDQRYDKWEEKMEELQSKVASREGEVEQLIDQKNSMQSELQRVYEDLAKCKAEAEQLKKENTHYQEEERKHEEELRRLKLGISGEHAHWEDKINIYKEEIRELQVKETTLVEEVSSLKAKDAQNQKELAALRLRKEDMTTLIRERDSHQEEIDKLRKYENTRKEKMAQLRRERDDYLLQIRELKENKTTQVSADLLEEFDNLVRERDELRRKEATQQEEATQMRQERDSYKEEMDQLKWRESRKLTQMRRERDKYKEEVDQLKETEKSYKEKISELSRKESNKVAELQQEITSLNGEIHRLTWRENPQLAQMRRERDEYREDLDKLKRKEAVMESQMADVKRERDGYRERADELKTREAQIDQIIQMTLEKDNSQNSRETENSKVAQLEQEVHSYKVRIEECKKKEASLELKIKQIGMEKNDYIRNLETEINKLQQNKGYGKEQLENEKREDALKDRIKQMEEEKENHQKKVDKRLAQLWGEKNSYREEVEELKKRETELEDQQKQMMIDNNILKKEIDNCKLMIDKYKQNSDQLLRTNSSLENKLRQVIIERDNCISGRDFYWGERNGYKEAGENYKKERDKYKQEVEQLERTHHKEITQLGHERDQYMREAEHLMKQVEAALGASEARQREDTRLQRDLADIEPPSPHLQQCTSMAAEGKMVVTVGHEEEEVMEVEEIMMRMMTQGLPNLGNTCYINSVLQCLYHLLPLRNTLDEYARLHYTGTYQDDHSGTRVALALAQVFGAMQSATETEIRLALRGLKSVIGSLDESFRGKQQREAHDLFSALVSWLCSDLSQCEAQDSSSCPFTLFNGMMESNIVCLKNHLPLTHTSEAFTSLSLPVVGVERWSLQALLDNHLREQSMYWDCHHCRSTHNCSHRTHIKEWPLVLVIHFSRVAGYTSTSKTKVDFPITGLSLQQHMAPHARQSPRYRLVAVVCHEGSMSSGHYTAYCRYGSGRRGGKWRMCNDEWVGAVNERVVLEDENAHLLFYIQQRN